MQFYKAVDMILETLNTAAQDMNTVFNVGLKQMTHNIHNNPKGSVVGLLELIKRTPGMYADLLSGRMEQLQQKFLHLGVDFAKIADLVYKAREMAEKERSGKKIPVKRAIPLTEKSIHDPVRPGILKRKTKGKLTCSKARGIKSKQKNKGNNTAKAAQRYLNYHC